MPHLYCLRGDPGVLWLQVCSDLAIALSYFAIPLVLLRVVLKRKEVLFRWVAVLFVLFIAACGTTHLLAVWTIWSPMYRLEGLVKGVTAVVSMTTAVALVRLRPQLERLPSIEELESEVRERRAAEEAARDKEERFRNFVESVQDYAIFMIDPKGVIQTWNRGAERMKGYTAEEIVGRHFSCFYTPEEIAEDLPAEMLRVAREAGRCEREGWRVRKDGTRFLANVILRPLSGPNGELRGFSKVTRDLTETRAMEARFEMLLESAPDPIVIVRSDGAIDYINAQAERIFGYQRAEVAGKSVDLLVPEKNREAQAVYRDALFHSGQHPMPSVPGELRGKRKDGTSFPLEFSLSPLDTREGRLLLFAVRDLTERRRTEARFQAILEAAPDAIVMNNRAGRIVYINHHAEELYGYPRGMLLGRSVDTLIPERLREERKRRRESFFLDPEGYDSGFRGEYTCVRADGSEFEVEASRRLLETSDGFLAMAVIRDLSVRRQADLRFRNLLESAPDAMVISGSDGLIELTNLEAERLFGYSREEMIGQPVEILIPPDLRGFYERDMEQFFHGSEEREIGAGVELRARRRDGSEIPVEIRFSPLQGPKGLSITAAIRDITERRKAEMRFRALLESAPDAMVIVNAAGIIELANLQAEKLFQYSRMELLGKSVDVLVPSSLRGAHAGYRGEFFAAPRKREMGAGRELMAVRKDGSEFPVEISLSPLESAEGISVTAAIRDVTERKQAAALLAQTIAELRHSNEALEQFAHVASHDLQEPLRMVASFTQLLSKRYKGRLDADADEFIHYAVDGTQRMKRMIEDLLQYSRAGKGDPPEHELQVEAVLREAMSNLRAAIEESGAQVTWDPMPQVLAPESQLVQIFQNLIGNAIKYRGKEAPHVHIEARSLGQAWQFSVSDNGIGIEEKSLEKIFLIFHRLHGRGEFEGNGVGLAICKQILQQRGGKIWAESNPGQGSTFHFVYPIKSAHE